MNFNIKPEFITYSMVGLVFFTFLLVISSENDSQPVTTYNDTNVTKTSEAKKVPEENGDIKNINAPSSSVELDGDDVLSVGETAGEEEGGNVEQGKYQVIKVVDGDTVSIDYEGQVTSVRLIGLDTPETVHPSKPVQCFGQEASNKARELLSDKEVALEFDESQGQRDKYGRLLAYVFLPDGTNFNQYMISQGYAYEYTYNVPYKYQESFKESEKEARQQELGLWASGVCDNAKEKGEVLGVSSSEEEKTPSVPTATYEATNSDYECSYNAYNCSDFNTHQEAQTVYEACGGVGNDIHRLDRDKDGISCKSLP